MAHMDPPMYVVLFWGFGTAVWPGFLLGPQITWYIGGCRYTLVPL